jgi:Molybdopterin converting factor, small subunit
MKVNIIIFGQLSDLLGEKMTLCDIRDTDQLITELNKMFPALANAKYAMAVDKKVVAGNILLTDQCTVALMPPFSGG